LTKLSNENKLEESGDVNINTMKMDQFRNVIEKLQLKKNFDNFNNYGNFVQQQQLQQQQILTTGKNTNEKM